MWHDVTGHDDEIYEPSRSALAAHGLLADKDGRDPTFIRSDIDMIVLGMHATADNPELIKAQELGLKIKSYPEVIYELSKDKTRAVIAGSHGKTTTTSMVMHILKGNDIEFDRVVWGIVPGFDSMVSLSEDNKIIIIEWDEYPDGKVNMTAKMLLYKHDIGILNGIARDHITTYPTFESYLIPFQQFVDQTPVNGYLGYVSNDSEVANIMNHSITQATTQWYAVHPHIVRDGITYLITSNGEISLKIFGAHNCSNISAAKIVCTQLRLSDEQFYSQIGSFTGAGNRLQLIHQDDDKHLTILRDFAHSPSKLTATVSAVREQYPDKKIIAVFELHTFASLSASFLPEYAGSMDGVDHACVYYDEHSFATKHMTALSKQEVVDGFACNKLTVSMNWDSLAAKSVANFTVCDSPADLKTWYNYINLDNSVVVLMSSGNFGGVEFI